MFQLLHGDLPHFNPVIIARGSVTDPVTADATAVSGLAQEGPAAFALTPLEITIAGRNRILTGLKLVAIHGNAH